MKTADEIKKIARETLVTEADSVRNLVSFIGNDFVKTVETIYHSKGRVVITGIGKSAIVAQKIVATLNSTGTPASFMHAADAVHGDLGTIQRNDVVICISKSGNSAEVKVLVPLLKSSGNKLVAMVSNLDSYLAKQVDFVLNATVTKEACPNNLAPTSSTTAQMALGDALAVCLLKCRNFSKKDFARFHPGGALGKQLYLTAADIYKHNEKPTVKTSDSIKKVILEISSKRLGATAVLNGKKLAGIITDGDLRRMMERKENISKLNAAGIMNKTPKTIQAKDLAIDALKIMREKNITQLIVMEGEKFAGFIHLHDLLREGLI